MEVPPELVGVAVLLGVIRWVLPGRERKRWVYWPLTAANLPGAAYFAIRGVSGLEGYSVVRGLLVALVGVHIVQNLSARDRAQHDAEMVQGRKDRSASAPLAREPTPPRPPAS